MTGHSSTANTSGRGATCCFPSSLIGTTSIMGTGGTCSVLGGGGGGGGGRGEEGGGGRGGGRGKSFRLIWIAANAARMMRMMNQGGRVVGGGGGGRDGCGSSPEGWRDGCWPGRMSSPEGWRDGCWPGRRSSPEGWRDGAGANWCGLTGGVLTGRSCPASGTGLPTEKTIARRTQLTRQPRLVSQDSLRLIDAFTLNQECYSSGKFSGKNILDRSRGLQSSLLRP
jgi:hypothetical protein